MRRLSRVPFEFNGIAQKWDTIQIEDLKLDNNKVLVVNSTYSLKYLLDETGGRESKKCCLEPDQEDESTCFHTGGCECSPWCTLLYFKISTGSFLLLYFV